MGRIRRSFGTIKTMPNGRFHVSYVAPNGRRYNAPTTYGAKVDGEGFLSEIRKRIELGAWVEPGSALDTSKTFRVYAESWVAQRDLKPRTRQGYEDLLRLHILPTLGDLELRAITPEIIRSWHSSLGRTTPTRNAHAYSLVHAIFGTALEDEVPGVTTNPCRIRKAMTAKRAGRINLITPAELVALADEMPDELSASILISGWCGTRWGELSELRRKDLDKDCTTINIRRAVTYRSGKFIVDTPKTAAGQREVTIPPHVRDAIKEHLRKHVGKGPNSLLFKGPNGTHLGDYAYRKVFKPAAAKIGHPDLRVHDLRHVGAVLAAQAGATTAELMNRIGHTTPAMVMRYQHVAAGRDAEIAARLSRLVEDSGPT